MNLTLGTVSFVYPRSGDTVTIETTWVCGKSFSKALIMQILFITSNFVKITKKDPSGDRANVN